MPHKIGDKARAGASVNFLRRTVLLDPPHVHDGDVVAEHQRLFLIMRHKERGDLHLPRELMQFDLHGLPELAIERAERLIQDQNARLNRQRPCKGDTLLLTARHLRRIPIRHLIQPHHLEHPFDALVDGRCRNPSHFQPERDVLGHRHVRKQRQTLKHHSNIAVGGVRGRHVPAREQHRTQVGFFRPAMIRNVCSCHSRLAPRA